MVRIYANLDKGYIFRYTIVCFTGWQKLNHQKKLAHCTLALVHGSSISGERYPFLELRFGGLDIENNSDLSKVYMCICNFIKYHPIGFSIVCYRCAVDVLVAFLSLVHAVNKSTTDYVVQMSPVLIGTVSAKIAPLLKCYKNASRLNRYNFPTDYAIDSLFSTLHSEMV